MNMAQMLAWGEQLADDLRLERQPQNAGLIDEMIFALRSMEVRTCSSCAHYDANSAAAEGVGYCTNPVGWHRARSMPPHEMCSKWEKADE